MCGSGASENVCLNLWRHFLYQPCSCMYRVTQKNGNFWKTNKTKTFLWRKHAVDHSTDPWLLMARLSVALGPCSAVLPTVHGCHYAFQKFPFFCVTLYQRNLHNNWGWVTGTLQPLEQVTSEHATEWAWYIASKTRQEVTSDSGHFKQRHCIYYHITILAFIEHKT